MGYTTNPSKVRVDIFKSSGKWYETVELDMNKGWDKTTILHDQFKKAWIEQYPHRPTVDNRLDSDGWFLVCLEPYHENSHPIVVWLK